ncbi:hypothetical protein D7Y13_41880, partial [Corallococcus praedator]
MRRASSTCPPCSWARPSTSAPRNDVPPAHRRRAHQRRALRVPNGRPRRPGRGRAAHAPRARHREARHPSGHRGRGHAP